MFEGFQSEAGRVQTAWQLKTAAGQTSLPEIDTTPFVVPFSWTSSIASLV